MSTLQWPLIHGLHGRGRGRWRAWIEARVLQKPFVLMVFHDLEFATPADLAGLPPGALTAAHVCVPLEQRLLRIEQWITAAKRSHLFATLREVAEVYVPECARAAR